MSEQEHLLRFEAARPRLLGLAYRVLGSLADAEDVVQETYLKWRDQDTAQLNNADAWLTTVCTRHCLDLLRSAHHRRVNYVGAWLPEPIHTLADGDAQTESELASSLTTAFLLLLDRLSPKERAAYLLHHIFDVPYPEISETLGVQEVTCRKLVSRARANLEKSKTGYQLAPERQQQFLNAFQQAVMHGSLDGISKLLADDVQLTADGGGKVATINKILEGREVVGRFLVKRIHRYWQDYQWSIVSINGSQGIVLRWEKQVMAAVTFSYDTDGLLTDVFIMRNPDKLVRLNTTVDPPPQWLT